MSLTINRNNEITDDLVFWKKRYKTSQSTTAIYCLSDEARNGMLPEIERLKEIEIKYNELTTIIEQQINLENQLKLSL